MGKYTIFYLFENPRRGMQARNFTTNVPKILDLKSSSEQIFSRKLSLGAPETNSTLLTQGAVNNCYKLKQINLRSLLQLLMTSKRSSSVYFQTFGSGFVSIFSFFPPQYSHFTYLRNHQEPADS